MADDPQFTPEDRALFEAEVNRLRQQELPRARDEEIKAAAQRAVARDLEQEREAYREELDSAVAQTTAESVAEERAEARREAPSKLMLLLVLLVVVLLLLAVTGNLHIPFVSGGERAEGLSAKGALTSVLGPTATPIGGVGAVVGGSIGGVDAGNASAADFPGIDPAFVDFYRQHDGLRTFGLPLGDAQIVNNRRVQMFERARFEEWPESPDPRYRIQLGLLGREYTMGRFFPIQTFFNSRPGLWYFPETSHGLGGQFLQYWLDHGGLDIFGYPISDELPEVLEDGRIHTVQYFERARMEIHPDRPEGDQVLLGLLGTAIAKSEPVREQLAAPVPTPVPLP